MCGRFYIAPDPLSEDMARIIAQMNKDPRASAQVTYGEMFPSQYAPVIVKSPEGWGVQPLKWGFPRENSSLVINSRSERAAVSPMFRQAVQQGRCLIPMNGFFEWRRDPDGSKTKDKFYFTTGEHATMFLAGIHQVFADPTNGGAVDRFVILTQPANDQMEPYHHRMPVVLDSREARHAWLFAPPQTQYAHLQKLFHAPVLSICRASV